MTIVLDSTSTRKLALVKELALELGIKVTEPDKPIKKKRVSQKEIMELSKKINSEGTKKAFAKLGIDYDSYCR